MADAKNPKSTGEKTEVFRVLSADATIPEIHTSEETPAPSLSIIKGPQTGMTFDLLQNEITIGRDPSNGIFLNDMTVSRRHARILLSGQEEGRATIEDLGSLNGTWVDGAIVNTATISDGSTIQIGTFRMVFHTTASYDAL